MPTSTFRFLAVPRCDLLACLFVWMIVWPASCRTEAQELPEGFHRISGTHVDLITDLEIDDSIRSLTEVFDAAVPQWSKFFRVAPKEVKEWRVEAYLMGAKERFKNAGLIPSEVPDFPYGFQYGNRVWLVEQPSDYYRRHLLLHEGTHWFMNRKYTDHGPPWLMEGMAEWLGTHRWDGKKLELGVIPKTRDEVPYWGRIALIQEQLASGIAPSLETILRYDNRAHQSVDAYAWSWAATLFLLNNPATRDDMDGLFKLKTMRSDGYLTQWLLKRIQPQLPAVRQQWAAVVSELEYGYDPSHGMLTMADSPAPVSEKAVQVKIDVARTWQSSGVRVEPGEVISIDADGNYAVGDKPKPWLCNPEGVTIDYYRGEPLGKVIMTIAAGQPEESDSTQPIDVIAVGRHAEVKVPKAGELHFRVNESNRGLGDNSGSVQVSIKKS